MFGSPSLTAVRPAARESGGGVEKRGADHTAATIVGQWQWADGGRVLAWTAHETVSTRPCRFRMLCRPSFSAHNAMRRLNAHSRTQDRDRAAGSVAIDAVRQAP